MSGNVWQTITQLAAVAVLIVLNGYFVASEYSLVAIRRSRVEQLVSEGRPRARWVQGALNNLNLYISATQIGVTLASLILGSVGEPVIVHLIEPLFGRLPPRIGFLTAHGIAFAIAFLIVTYLTILIGELIPKRVAIQEPERTALAIVALLRFLLIPLRPLIWLLDSSANVLLRLLRLNPAGEHAAHSEEELRILLRESEQEGVLDRGEREMIDRVFSFADKEAERVMVPRTQVTAVEIDRPIATVAQEIATSVYTRFPVYEENLDTIRGMVHIKDIVAAMGNGRGGEQIRAIMRTVLIVPQSVHIDDLMLQMRRRHIHMAVLVDDYGGTAGLVTMEDLIEELVGDIEDEFDPAATRLKRNPDGSVTLDGRTPIAEVTPLVPLGAVDGGYETIAGYVLDRTGRIPRAGERVETDGLTIQIDRMDRLRIAQVTIFLAEATASSHEAAAD